jgi:hypothetical protein
LRNPRGKKKRAAPSLSRVDLAKALNCGLTSIDKLIAVKGLRSCGRRGRAKLYSEAEARRLLVKLGPAETTAAQILLRDYQALAEDLRDRRRTIVETLIADEAWIPCWRAVVRWFEKQTASWPETIAAILAPLKTDDVLRLDGDERWQGLRPPVPLVRPLLEALADAVEAGPKPPKQYVALDQALAVPAADAAPAAPTDVDDARSQWHEARALFRSTRTAARRGHRRRARVLAAIDRAHVEARLAWMAEVPGDILGDRRRAREWAEERRREALSMFARVEAA